MVQRRMDCLVLSGGGAKGAYGAGAAKAIHSYHHLKQVKTEMCYVGTSAGALNSAVLALLGVEQLEKFWFELTPGDVLGWFPKHPIPRFVRRFFSPWQWLKLIARIVGADAPFSLYSSRHLKSLLETKLTGDSLSDAHLVLTTTNYTTGEPAIHFLNSEFNKCVVKDRSKTVDDQRLSEFSLMSTIEELNSALRASASIPIAFPPVKMPDGCWHVDGGLANNTPVRQAALYLRHMHQLDPTIEVGEVYCVIQNTPETFVERSHRLGAFSQLNRAYELLHFAEMLPVIVSWEQINGNIERNGKRVETFMEFLQAAEVSGDAKESIKAAFLEQFQFRKSSTKQLNMKLLKIQPSTPLRGLLDFSKNSIRSMFDHGYRDTLQVLRDRDRISDPEKTTLLKKMRLENEGS